MTLQCGARALSHAITSMACHPLFLLDLNYPNYTHLTSIHYPSKRAFT